MGYGLRKSALPRCQFHQHFTSAFCAKKKFKIDHRVSINFTNIAELLFCAKVFFSTFLYLQLGFVIFYPKNTSTKAACKKLKWNWLQEFTLESFNSSNGSKNKYQNRISVHNSPKTNLTKIFYLLTQIFPCFSISLCCSFLMSNLG